LDSSNIIRKYLLGLLTEDEQERVEERLLVERDFFEQVNIVEDELIDEYLDDSLSEKERFVTYFLAAPQQRQKLKRAQALKRYISTEVAPSEAELTAAANYNQRPHSSWLSRALLAIRTRTTAAP
jgi:hypothetical protein